MSERTNTSFKKFPYSLTVTKQSIIIMEQHPTNSFSRESDVCGIFYEKILL